MARVDRMVQTVHFVLDYRSMRRCRKTVKGLTLSEILVSIALLTLMLVTTLVLFAQLLASTTKSGYLSVATVYADRVLEYATNNPESSSPAFPPLRTGEQEFLVQGEDSPTKFVYRLEATQLARDLPHGERWMLDVEVRWWTDDPNSDTTARAGYGELRTRQSRLVYVRW